ncbi:hypothetical protein E4U09_007122 [Claviceps aff. purpurea]|uniref:Uncharacterized protein n=1 Tax=Claviceps aff. purpurea TaxID=1967640 RepID=A0A9P7U2Q9_9HYPO|nr:hypothetical protein E4U09_007122 [Claviceps aff. purpurea]
MLIAHQQSVCRLRAGLGPDRANEEVVPWLQSFSKELKEFSRSSDSTDDDVSLHDGPRAVLGLPNEVIKGHLTKQQLDDHAGFISAADLESRRESLSH